MVNLQYDFLFNSKPCKHTAYAGLYVVVDITGHALPMPIWVLITDLGYEHTFLSKFF